MFSDANSMYHIGTCFSGFLQSDLSINQAIHNHGYISYILSIQAGRHIGTQACSQANRHLGRHTIKVGRKVGIQTVMLTIKAGPTDGYSSNQAIVQ